MLSQPELEHLKTLARLELSEDETAQLGLEIRKILVYFEKLREVDTDGVEEMARPIALENVMRPDVPAEPFSQATALALAVEQEDGFFKVPRVIE